MAIEYRRAVDTDASQLATLRWEFKNSDEQQGLVNGMSVSEFLDTCESFMRQGIAGGNWIHWIAEEAGQIIGMASLQTIEEIPEPEHPCNRYGRITNVYTKPGRRRQGVGAQLLAALRETAQEEGIGFLALWTSDAARSLYQRCGFVPDAEAMFWERR